MKKISTLLCAGLFCAASLHAASLIPSTDRDTVLYNFDDGNIPPAIKVNGAAAKLIGNPNGKGNALQVDISAKNKYSGISVQPKGGWDFSDKGEFSFAFDIANTGEVSVQLFANVSDKHGASQTRTAIIPTGGETQTYYILLKAGQLEVDSGLRNDPAATDLGGNKFIWLWGSKTLDVSGIKKVGLNTDTILHDRQLVISNIRLIQNPEMNPDFLKGVVDKFGQNNHADYPNKVKSEKELKKRSAKELADLAKSGPMAGRSKFGGWKDGPKLEATGYFRTEKIGRKWALVDPEGYLYFAAGIANARMANTTVITGVDFHKPTVRDVDPEGVTPDDSMPFIKTSAEARNTRFVASELRHNMFNWLPGYDSPYEDHYHYKRETHTGPLKHGESFSFYQANLERKYGQTSPESYLEKWRDVTVDRFLNWGFTCMGNWADAMFFQVDRIPYFANGWIIGNFKTVSSGNDFWAPLPDPFDPEFVRRTRVTVEAIAADVKGNPWCVGVFIDNEKSWGRMGSFDSQYGVVVHTLPRDAADCPTKEAWVGIMKKQYADIAALNAAWDTSFSSWDAFAKNAQVNSRNAAVKKDFATLLSAFADEYFRVVRSELKKVMPNHLYMGARMAHWGMTPEVVGAAKKYSDVVSYNYYKEGIRDQDWKFLAEVDRPSIIGEFHMGATSDTGLFHPGLIVAQDQEDRGRMYQDYMKSVIDNPYFVGAHWFQYIDSPLAGRGYDGENYNVGFVTVTDIPYTGLVEAAKELHRNLYERRYGDLKKTD